MKNFLRQFRVQVIWRATVLFGLLGLTFWTFFRTEFVVIPGLLFVVSLAMLVHLIRFVERQHKHILNFLTAIQQHDYNTNFQIKNQGRPFRQLYETMRAINQQFQNIQADQESQFQYLQTVVQHVKVGLICIHANGKIELMNPAFAKIIQKPFLRKLEALQAFQPKLYAVLQNIQQGERQLLRMESNGVAQQLTVEAVQFSLRNKDFKLVSLQDIQSELEAAELEAWQQLIRTLTHEIMNSVSSITSLSQTLNKHFEEDWQTIDSETQEDIRLGIAAIRRRSEGLLAFTKNYQNIARPPKPERRLVAVNEWLEQTCTLLQPKMKAAGINFEKQYLRQEASLRFDGNLMAQVLINVLQNAIDAMNNQPEPLIHLQATLQHQQLHLLITDNGSGIPPEVMEQIFIPFFTTKPQGSGIGLPLSRQIVRAHEGTLSIKSRIGEGTSVRIVIGLLE